MNHKRKKILIIKTGFSEFLDRGISTTVSYGDVLMCTAILHRFTRDHVTWVTSWAAREILKNNPYIDELLIFGPKAMRKVLRRKYDVLINLEKDIGISTWLTALKAKKRFGFYFDDSRHNINCFCSKTRFLLQGQENQKDVRETALEILFETIGQKWRGEDFILKPRRVKEKYDIGFNYSVGSKWPTKAWPLPRWRELERKLNKKYAITWQQGQRNLSKYFDWIAGCRLVVTSDSLGQAAAQALGKKVVTLFGPTNPQRMRGLKNIHFVCSPLKCPHMPCYMPMCKYRKFCMDHIKAEKVASLCERLLK